MKDIIIMGAGGHASVVIDIIESMKRNDEDINIRGILDDNDKITEFMGYPILDKLKNALLYTNENTQFVIGIGNNTIRKKILNELKGLNYFTPIHPTAIIGSNVSIDEGTVIMPRAIINANAIIGKQSIINSGAIIEHDNRIGNFVHISPGAVLAGGVVVGDLAHIGANSTIIQCINIGSDTIIGAGSTVIRDMESNVVAVGSPAKVIKNRSLINEGMSKCQKEYI